MRLSTLGTSATCTSPRMVDNECAAVGGTDVLGENLPQFHFPLCSPQIPYYLGSNPGRRGAKPATNRLSYGTALSDDLTHSNSLRHQLLSDETTESESDARHRNWLVRPTPDCLFVLPFYCNNTRSVNNRRPRHDFVTLTYCMPTFLVLSIFILLFLNCATFIRGNYVLSRSQWRRGLSVERWERGFESHSRHGCLCAFILCLCCSVCR
jgi:hypothetical protein